MKYKIVETNQYKKALKKYKKSGNFDLDKLNKIINILAETKKVPQNTKTTS
jgi:mRNA-degrading endonuclease YafQ of YafQ-DinJ toxin-antitoxin module